MHVITSVIFVSLLSVFLERAKRGRGGWREKEMLPQVRLRNHLPATVQPHINIVIEIEYIAGEGMV
jgi:hypothetical protein